MKLEFEEDLFSDQFKSKENSLLFNVDHKKKMSSGKNLYPLYMIVIFMKLRYF